VEAICRTTNRPARDRSHGCMVDIKDPTNRIGIDLSNTGTAQGRSIFRFCNKGDGLDHNNTNLEYHLPDVESKAI